MVLKKFWLYFHTIKYLRWTQISYRIYYLVRARLRNLVKYRFQEKQLSVEQIPQLSLQKSLPAVQSIFYKENKFSFLNLGKQYKDKIDWNDLEYKKLWTYNLNYFEFLHLEGLHKEEGIALIYKFINDDSVKIGLEPYATSLRLLHTIKFLTYHQINNRVIAQSLYNQTWRLLDNLEYHILGNHLIENGFGLLFGAYYFENDIFYNAAKKILVNELNEQVLSDGAHFELSPMYHQLMLYRILDCFNLIKNNAYKDQELLTLIETKAQLMLNWLTVITFKNGSIPLLNDSANLISPMTREITNYARNLGINADNSSINESGYRKFERNNYEIIVDVGKIGPDYIPGHAHSDTFNFVLHVNQHPFIIDTGISTYNSTSRRQLERSTESHNTVQIGQFDQTEVWLSFRVARRIYPKILEDTSSSLRAKLDYSTTKATHERSFYFSDNHIEIVDKVIARTNSKAYLHFHPNIQLTLENQTIKTNLGDITINGASNIEIVDYYYAPEFNKLIPAQKAVIYFSKTIKTIIEL